MFAKISRAVQVKRVTAQLFTAQLVGASLIALLLASAAAAGGHKSQSSMKSKNTIVDVAASTGQFETLIAAAKAAGLAGALTGDGPLTVFAPTDAAFAKLPKGTVETLLKPENKDQLVAILTYHVAPAKLKAADVVASDRIETLNGKRPKISVDGSKVTIDNANIIQVDVAASNGVIHVIDSVLLPPERPASNAEYRASDNTRAVIEMAINKGAPLYNHGQKAACADLYEVTAASLLTMDDSLGKRQRRALEVAMRDARNTHSDSQRAWIMRDALDAVYDGRAMRMTAN